MSRGEILLVELGENGPGRTVTRLLGDDFAFTILPSAQADPRNLLPALRVRPYDAAVLCEGEAPQPVDGLIECVTAADLPLMLVTSRQDATALSRLLERGISDLLLTPLRRAELFARLQRLIGWREQREGPALRLKQHLGLRRLIGRSAAFLTTIERIPLFAKCDATVLIQGETGTGKEVCARAIHYLSSRSGGPFVPVNCAAIPLELIENELFGHEQDAYTGATSAKHGLVREADRGTLFLDEIDNLPPIAQVKLLRLLQEHEYRPLGSSRTQTVDIRLLAATNSDVELAVRRGKLREDFYYRLHVLSLMLPPLRERATDVLLLARQFLRKFSTAMGRPQPQLSASALECLLNHDWPGNVRELEHLIERALVLADGEPVIRSEHIQLPLARGGTESSFQQAKSEAISKWERRYIESLLAAHHGNITHAARAAKKHRRAFWELIRKHDIDAQHFREDSDAAAPSGER